VNQQGLEARPGQIEIRWDVPPHCRMTEATIMGDSGLAYRPALGDSDIQIIVHVPSGEQFGPHFCFIGTAQAEAFIRAIAPLQDWRVWDWTSRDVALVQQLMAIRDEIIK
jgi:hypothetical protein